MVTFNGLGFEGTKLNEISMSAEIVSFLWTLVWPSTVIFKYGWLLKGREEVVVLKDIGAMNA